LPSDLTNRAFGRAQDSLHTSLGFLEVNVMEVLWTGGQWSVRDVVQKLERKLAYTTVMTTLDRLFKKGLLQRHKLDRAFLYSTAVSRGEWERRRAGSLLADLLGGSPPTRELLLSSLVNAVGDHDAQLLKQLEEKIRAKRRELAESGQS
jgi:predicted transcriptional regulator